MDIDTFIQLDFRQRRDEIHKRLAPITYNLEKLRNKLGDWTPEEYDRLWILETLAGLLKEARREINPQKQSPTTAKLILAILALVDQFMTEVSGR